MSSRIASQLQIDNLSQKNKTKQRAGEMDQCLRELAALPEDLSCILSTFMAAHKNSTAVNSSSKGSEEGLLASTSSRQKHCT